MTHQIGSRIDTRNLAVLLGGCPEFCVTPVN